MKSCCSTPVVWVAAALLTPIACQKQVPDVPPPEVVGVSDLLEDRELQSLGEKIFFDTDLSTPPGQSCAVCHSPDVGWTGPDEHLNTRGTVYPGAVAHLFGNRKPNASAYATLAPSLHAVRDKGTVAFVGGNFWDGRATGWKLGNPAADQAQGPFLNPVEQNNPDAATVVRKICQSAYASDLMAVARRLWKLDDICAENTELIYGIVALAVAAYEHSPAVNRFSSKYDRYLDGKASLTPEEKRGLDLFEGKGRCMNCHPSRPGPDGERPLFTDFTYDNLGFPRNPDNPWYGMPEELNPDGVKWVDTGLAGFLQEVPQYAMYARENRGKHRVPTLRNVDLRPRSSYVKAFGHNGCFKSLEMVVHFYNTRDILPAVGGVPPGRVGKEAWPPPEVAENINRAEMGNLGLSAEEEAALVAFLRTLSDGYQGE
ncbi:MAG: cytochrome c peroxidase [Bacteroidota bacterium]